MINRNLPNLPIFSLFCLLIGCSNPRFLQANPPHQPHQELSKTDELDFADVFKGSSEDSTKASTQHATKDTSSVLVSYRYPPYRVVNKKVRVALKQNSLNAVFYSIGLIDIHSMKADEIPSARGKLDVEISGDKVNLIGSWGKRTISLPCTLLSKNEYNYMEFGQDSYRGSFILLSEKPGCFTVVNLLDVEDYLRGVVPLELGKRSSTDIEALKAQSIAARTYTYKKMELRKDASWDVTSTISDQVYGGANGEYRESDLAIKLTKDLVLTYNDSLINAYYHSTCGGKTANIEDVWDKPRCDYLRSVSDLDSNGIAYCLKSAFFSWEEKWPRRQFSDIVLKSLNESNPQRIYKGDISVFKINSLYDCGRVKSCTIAGLGWTCDLGGDKIRFIVKRDIPGNAVLKSSQFTIASSDRKEIVVKGKGYGHGVGMCQMGALGRAEEGQTFDQILHAYYSGVQIRTASFR